MLNGAPLVSIVTLNYNQTALTCQFLESTRFLKYTNFEILVCDMASDLDPSKEILSGRYPKVRLLISPKNLGFAAGNNWGIRQSKGEFIFIVNNDTEVTPDLVNLLLEPFFNDEKIGLCSPKIKFYDKPDTIQYAGFGAMNPYTGRSFTIGEMEKDTGLYDLSGVTNAAHGCAMMVKREVLDKTGMFPEIFFLYYEEWDLSARILKADYKIWYEAKALIYHKESMSVGKQNPLKTYYLTRNRILYMRRNSAFFNLLIFSLFFTFFTIPKSVARYLFKKQFKQLKVFFSAIFWNLGHSNKSAL